MADPSENATTPIPPEVPSTAITSRRSLKQLSLFLAGSSFLAFSTLITRRSLGRRYAATVPRFYAPSNRPPSNTVNGPFEAVEALSIATISVTSFMMMMAGGALWAFDISTMDDLRRKVRGGLGIDGTGRSERQAEEDFEEWLAETLARKDQKRRSRGEDDEEKKTERGRPR